MITPVLNKDGFTGHILIEPNRPISWHENLRFIKALTVVSFIIAATALSQGFFLTMPYSGLEIMFISICLYQVYRHYSTCQIVYFTDNSVIIESGKRCADKRIEYQRYWSKFHIDNKGLYNIPRLSIRSKGKTTEIGYFLGYSDKLILINLIKRLTLGFQKK